MQGLTQALDNIMEWLENHLPEYAASFLPGLTLDEIFESVEVLGFPLPDELYELYQWRNGTREHIVPSFIFPVFEFLSLDKATALQEMIDSDSIVRELFTFKEQPLFPFVENDGESCSTIVEKTSTLESPVIYIAKQGGGEYLEYSSVTSMMCNFAECFETGAYYLDEEGYINSHPAQVAEVLRKNEPQLVKQALIDIEILFTEFELDYDTQMFISYTLQALERFRPPETSGILQEALIKYGLDESRKGKTILNYINRTLQNISK